MRSETPAADALGLGGQALRGWSRRLVSQLPGPIQTIAVSASSIVGATAATSLLGAVYWWLAARQFPAEAVGLASSAISAMTLIATLSSLGLGTFLMGALPSRPDGGRTLIAASLIISGGGAGVMAFAFAFAAPILSSDLDPLGAGPLPALVFAAGAALTAAGLVLDQALIGLLRGGLQLGRNVVLGVTKLGVLFLAGAVLARESGMDIYSAWVAGLVFSFLGLAPLLPIREMLAGVSVTRWVQALPSAMATAWKSMLSHQALNLALRLPIFLLPVLAVVLVSAVANASFYIAWLVVNLAFVAPGSLATVLYTVGSGDRDALAEKIRMTLKLALVLTVAATIVLLSVAGPLMSIFGKSYSENATTVLRILALSGIPILVKNHYVAVVRIQGRVRAAQPLVWFGTVLELALAAAGASAAGLEGLAVGWTAAVFVEGIIMYRPVREAAKPR